MPTVLLVRHGQASYGAADYDVLSERGRRQSARVAEDLAARGIVPTLVAAGTLRRQRDTAAAVAGPLGLAIQEHPGFDEYDSDQALAFHSDSPVRMDRTVDPDAPVVASHDFQRILDQALLDWIAAGESTPAPVSFPAFRDGCIAALEAVVAQLGKGETAVVVSSGGVVAAVALALLGVPDAMLVTFNRVCVNASVTKLIAGSRGITLSSFNEQGHLDVAGGDLLTYR